MTFNEKMCEYYRKKYIQYLFKTNTYLKDNEIKRIVNFTKYKINHPVYICGIDDSICVGESCTRGFNDKGCMYLKDFNY